MVSQSPQSFDRVIAMVNGANGTEPEELRERGGVNPVTSRAAAQKAISPWIADHYLREPLREHAPEPDSKRSFLEGDREWAAYRPKSGENGRLIRGDDGGVKSRARGIHDADNYAFRMDIQSNVLHAHWNSSE